MPNSPDFQHMRRLGDDLYAVGMTELAVREQRPLPYIITALTQRIEDEGLCIEVCAKLSVCERVKTEAFETQLMKTFNVRAIICAVLALRCARSRLCASA